MKFASRLKRLEALPPPPVWHFNVDDLARGWEGVTDDEREYLESLKQEQIGPLIERMYAMPIEELRESARHNAFSRLIFYANYMRRWDDPEVEDDPPTT